MQMSPYHLLPKILDVVAILQPRSILDIGCGDGFIGLSIKRYVNNDIILDGVESSQKPSRWMQDVYRNILRTDIRKQPVGQDETYDLVLILETLGDINKREGKKLLKSLIAHHGGVLISASREQWDKGDIAELGNVLFLFDAERTLVYLTKDPAKIKSLRRQRITTTILRGAKTSKTVSRIIKRVTSTKKK